jgi:hypothetical protein
MRAFAAIGAAVLATTVAAVVIDQPSAGATTRASAISTAAAYGPAHGYHVGIAVFDTKTGKAYGGGSYKSSYASESVVKTMIATRLILQGRMHGTTATRAYKMITQSDDAIASSFYGSVGGDGLITWIKKHYNVPLLGSPPHRSGWWGNTHITALGLVQFYAKVAKDKKVGPWLINAMRHATKYGSDGTYQYFGLPSATSGAAIKQGWGDDFDDWGKSADFNTTGFVNGNRYAVAILGRGPVKTYGTAIGNMLTHTAKLLLPGGAFPDETPIVTGLSFTGGPVAGGTRLIVHGANFTHVWSVWFAGVRATGVRVLSSTAVEVTAPKHSPGSATVKVVTNHGTSSPGSVRFAYVLPPTIKSITPVAGGPSGGTLVHITGTNFIRTWSVWFGGVRGTALKALSSTSLTVVAPPHAAGTFDLRVITSYGTSAVVGGDRFSYVATPAITDVSPTSGGAAGGATVTVTGTGLGAVTGVLFGAVPGTQLAVAPDGSTLTVVSPAQAAGTRVDIRLQSPYGQSAVVSADAFSYTG